VSWSLGDTFRLTPAINTNKPTLNLRMKKQRLLLATTAGTHLLRHRLVPRYPRFTLERTVQVNWTLEVVIVPVSNVDRAKAFYADQVGFHLDHDNRYGQMRVVQLTPPGSGCSIVVGEGIGEMIPGSLDGLQLVVPDITTARAQLVERGVEVSEVEVVGSGVADPDLPKEALDNVGFIYFSDPDGNGWAVQQISSRG
jgi:catechol 2,3-dioxygenase-like lactoylglutathione lyase family enzyme